MSNILRHVWSYALCAILLLPLLFPNLSPTATHAAPQLWLPTPPGEPWVVIQGYACGTHDGWDRYSLDMARSSGETRGAPVRAAADGTVFAWVEPTGTLIVRHGEGFYTMYTHMERATLTARGAAVTRGAVVGEVGDRGAPGNPHLHFTAFTSEGYPSQSPSSIPLSFADGYDLPDVGGCSQHGGETLTASSVDVPPAYRAHLPAVSREREAPRPPARVRPQRRFIRTL